jgi:16S rRNA (guanine1516-N2)-methyltransferase
MNVSGHTKSYPVVVVDATPNGDRREDADALADALGLARGAPQETTDDALVLAVTPDGLELREPGGATVRVDFRSIDLRTGAGNLSRRQPLARAIGRSTRRVIDATAGFGHDAVLLALMGFTVTAVERSPVVAALLRDGIERARGDAEFGPALGDRLEVVVADARAWLATTDVEADAIYIDPMYPPKRKASALPPKNVQMLRRLVGDDPDAADLVAVARTRAHRVVVKRPTAAEPLAPEPSFAITSKLVRYDVYVQAEAEASP